MMSVAWIYLPCIDCKNAQNEREQSMKSLLFLFFLGQEDCRNYAPDQKHEAFGDGVKAIFKGWGLFTVLTLMATLHYFGLWNALLNAMGQEAGSNSARNYASPIGIIGIVCTFVFYYVTKKYFSRPQIMEEIEERFNNYLGRAKAKKHENFLIYILFFNIMMGFAFAFGVWWLFGFCVVVHVMCEWWVRKTFYSNDSPAERLRK